MQAHATLDRLSDDELLRRLDELVSHSRRVEADLVAHIGEVERRRLYAREASPSMFAYCRERLHLSEAEAYMRIRVARAARKHPLLLDMLRDGRLHLSAIVRLLPVLTRENRDALLARATFVRSARSWRSSPSSAPGRTSQPACASCRSSDTRFSRSSRIKPCRPGRPWPHRRRDSRLVFGRSAAQSGGSGRPGRRAEAHLQPDRAGVQRADLLCPDTVAAASAPARLEPQSPRRVRRSSRARRDIRSSNPCRPAVTGSSSPPAPSCTTSSSGCGR